MFGLVTSCASVVGLIVEYDTSYGAGDMLAKSFLLKERLAHPTGPSLGECSNGERRLPKVSAMDLFRLGQGSEVVKTLRNAKSLRFLSYKINMFRV